MEGVWYRHFAIRRLAGLREVKCLPRLLKDWAVCRGSSYVSAGERGLWSRSHAYHHGHALRGPTGQVLSGWKQAWGLELIKIPGTLTYSPVDVNTLSLDTYFCNLCAHFRESPDVRQTCFQSSRLFPSRPLTNKQSHSPLSRNQSISLPQSTLFSTKWTNKVYCLGRLVLTAVLQGHPGWARGAATVHCVVLTIRLSWSSSSSFQSLILHQLAVKNLHEAIGVHSGRAIGRTVTDKKRVCAICSWNLLRPFGLAWAKF